MKKRFIISVIGCCFAFIWTGAQESSQPDSAKKKYSCFVKIETTTGENIEAALERLTSDSVFIATVEDKYIKAGGSFIKILKEEPETGIPVARISNFKIKYDRDIINHDNLVKRKKQLRRKNAGRIAGMVLSGIITSPFLLIGSTPAIIDSKDFAIGKRETAVSGNNLHVSKKYQTFQINGDNENYVRMVQRLTKNKTNPFENNIPKN